MLANRLNVAKQENIASQNQKIFELEKRTKKLHEKLNAHVSGQLKCIDDINANHQIHVE
jgi:hypothetical protein